MPRNGNRRPLRITRNAVKRVILERDQPCNREAREDHETRQDLREGSGDRDPVDPAALEDCRDVFESDRQTISSAREADERGCPSRTAEPVFDAIPETKPAVESERTTRTCFLSFPKKPTAIKAKKRNSAFHSPLRIAKFSFHSPPSRSERTLSTDSTLDLVFSPEDSPQLSKNETGTTAATSEIGRVYSDNSESFIFDLEVVKSGSGTQAKLLETGSVISKSSSSTLTTNFAAIRRSTFTRVAKNEEEKPFDELALDRHDDNRSLFSPIPWTPMHYQERKPTQVKADLIWPEVPKDEVVKEKNIFESAWKENRFTTDVSLSESGSWIDFTNDPFQSHASSALQRPYPTRVDESKTKSKNTSCDQHIGGDGFVLKKSFENKTMDNFVRRLSDSGVSEISFPSITHGGNTWSQFDSIDEQDTQEPLRPPTVAQPSLSSQKMSSQLLGSILQARFEANRKIRQDVVKAPKAASKIVPKQTMLMAPNKPPLRPKLQKSKTESIKGPEKIAAHDPSAPPIAIAKYVRMLGLGIPAGAVKNAMVRDGVDVSILFRTDILPAIPAESSKSNVAKDSRQFRIYWQPHSEVGTNTLWSKLQQDDNWLQEMLRVDENEFLALFSQERMSKAPTLRNQTTDPSIVRVIDSERANEGGIALSQIQLTYEYAAQAIDRMDGTALSMDQLKAILPYIPNAEEIVKLRRSLLNAPTGDWFICECEKFMVAMLRVTDAKEKLQHMIFMNGFADSLENLKKGKDILELRIVTARISSGFNFLTTSSDAILIQRACQEVMSSHHFRRVVGLILYLGNRINNCAANETASPACAITLDSLVTLTRSKALDCQTTFLQYVASLLRKCAPDTLDWKKEDMPSLRRAHKVKWNLWLTEVDSMEDKLSSLRVRCLQTSTVTKPKRGSTAPATAARLSDPTWKFVCQAEAKLATLKEEGEKGTHALESLWGYFGESSSTASRVDSVLGTLVLFGHQWEQAVERALRPGRESCRPSKATEEASEPEKLSPASSKASQRPPFLTSSQSYGHDV